MTETAALEPTARRGLGLVLASPSGAGKSTLSRQLLQAEKGSIELSVSVTTRARRPSEIDGVHALNTRTDDRTRRPAHAIRLPPMTMMTHSAR